MKKVKYTTRTVLLWSRHCTLKSRRVIALLLISLMKNNQQLLLLRNEMLTLHPIFMFVIPCCIALHFMSITVLQ